ncbi:MAG: ABC transporter permease [Actinomycetota bacterium]
MGRYVVRRVLWAVFVLILITMLTYVVFWVMPHTDPTEVFTHGASTQQASQLMRTSLGLDRPWYVQYGIFLKHLVAGDQYGWPGLGFSVKTRQPLKPILESRLLVTAQLAAGAALVWLALGIPIGVMSAVRQRSLRDRFALGFALIGVSAPVFWLGQMFLYAFWFKLKWAAGSGFYSVGRYGFLTWANHMIMPWVVLALLFAAFYARMARGNLIEVMSEDYIRTARAKGMSEAQVVLKHGMRAGLVPLVTMFGMDFGTLLGGAIITETVFNLPGVGQFAVTSVFGGDIYAVVDVTVLVGFFITVANLLVDIAYAYLDPRVRYA